jgi:hypothetical protein
VLLQLDCSSAAVVLLNRFKHPHKINSIQAIQLSRQIRVFVADITEALSVYDIPFATVPTSK